MSMIKGQKEYQKFLSGQPLTRKEAILANCYWCNGEEDSRADCGCHNCPLYQFQPYKSHYSKRKI